MQLNTLILRVTFAASIVIYALIASLLFGNNVAPSTGVAQMVGFFKIGLPILWVFALVGSLVLSRTPTTSPVTPVILVLAGIEIGPVLALMTVVLGGGVTYMYAVSAVALVLSVVDFLRNPLA